MTDFDYKSLKLPELEEAFKDANLHLTPRWHQYVSLAFTLGEGLNKVAYLHDVGTGKTLCAILTNLLWRNKKTLVVCPKSAFGAWERDIKRIPGKTYNFIRGTTKQRLIEINKDVDYSIIHYEGLKTIYAKFRKTSANPYDDRKSWQIDRFSFTQNFDCLVLDEIHKCKNYDALQSKICYELSRITKYTIGLTGTPLDKVMLELFNIYKVIDLGDSLGIDFFRFRYKHFNKRKFDWEIKPGHDIQILNDISKHTISFGRDECCDLIKGETIEKPILPSDEFLELQDKIITEESIEVGGVEIICDTGSLKSQKLSQLSSGFLYYKEDGEQQAYRLKENPKIDALMDMAEDSKDKLIVYHHYTEEALLIEEACKKNKIKYVSARGGLKEDTDVNIAKFLNDSSVKMLIAHPASASEGFEGIVTHIVVFFHPIASPKIRKQCEGRVDRDGQTKKCLFIDFVLQNSIDSKINENRGLRRNLVDTTLEYIRNYRNREN